MFTVHPPPARLGLRRHTNPSHTSPNAAPCAAVDASGITFPVELWKFVNPPPSS
jgi:hypothetical protein